MNTTHKYALILCVENENSINNRNTNLPFRYFEKESINCIKKWRENSGWLKDIPIYIMSPTEDVSQQTKDEYIKLNAIYLNKTLEVFKEHTHGFFNVHYVGNYFETLPELQDYCLIHIDLDMEILRELPNDYFDDLWNNKYQAFCGGYLEEDYKNQRKPLYSTKLTNTDFIANIPSKFMFYKEMINCINYVDDDYDKYVQQGYREYDREEYSSDYLISKNNVKLIIGYEQGEGYSHNNKNVYFWHEHYYDKPNVKLKLQKRKLLKDIFE